MPRRERDVEERNKVPDKVVSIASTIFQSKELENRSNPFFQH